MGGETDVEVDHGGLGDGKAGVAKYDGGVHELWSVSRGDRCGVYIYSYLAVWKLPFWLKVVHVHTEAESTDCELVNTDYRSCQSSKTSLESGGVIII